MPRWVWTAVGVAAILGIIIMGVYLFQKVS